MNIVDEIRLMAPLRGLSGVDPRIKLVVALSLGVMVWQASWPGLLIYSLFLGAIVFTYRHYWPGNRALLRTYVGFVCFWSLAKFLLSLVGTQGWQDAAIGASLVAGRISCLLLLGAALTMTTSSRSLGMGLSSLLRPVLGKERAWRTALAFALMVHFLPLTWRTVEQVRETIRRRCPRISVWQRIPLMVQAILRNLGRLTWDQSLAIAGRGLDQSEAWNIDFPMQYAQWGVGILFVAVSAILALL